MINFFIFLYVVIVLNYVIIIRNSQKNNQDKINFTLEHIQNEIKIIKDNLTISLE